MQKPRKNSRNPLGVHVIEGKKSSLVPMLPRSLAKNSNWSQANTLPRITYTTKAPEKTKWVAFWEIVSNNISGFLFRRSYQGLQTLTLDGIAGYMSSSRRQIVTIVGAGISTGAGIPDYYSLLRHGDLNEYNVPYLHAMFHRRHYKKNSTPFNTLLKKFYLGRHHPTKTHYFIKLLDQKGYLLRHYTQNFDGLERLTGLDHNKLIEVHGNLNEGICPKCSKCYSSQWITEKIIFEKTPICENCGRIVKPKVLFFGDDMKRRFIECYNEDLPKCDLLILMGTTLSVEPVSQLIYRVRSSCPRLVMNDRTVGNDLGFSFKSEKNKRDVMFLGKTDDGCQLLADKLGWGNELKEMAGGVTK